MDAYTGIDPYHNVHPIFYYYNIIKPWHGNMDCIVNFELLFKVFKICYIVLFCYLIHHPQTLKSVTLPPPPPPPDTYFCDARPLPIGHIRSPASPSLFYMNVSWFYKSLASSFSRIICLGTKASNEGMHATVWMFSLFVGNLHGGLIIVA